MVTIVPDAGPETTASLLRRAARTMRDTAAACPTPPWYALEIRRLRRDAGSEWMVDSDHRLVAGNVGISSDPIAAPLAAHIASWDPAVALAVADWLDACALVVTAAPNATKAHAERIARAYLGEPAA